MSNQPDDQPFQVVSRRNYGPSRKGPKANHVKQASSSHEEGAHKTSKPRPSRDIRSRSQSSHLNQERQRRDSDRQSTGDQSTGERSRHNSARGTSSDDLEFESSQEKDCSLLNGIAISEISSCSTQEGASKEQVSAPAEVAPAVAASTRCENATESPIQSSPDNNCRTVYTYSREFLLSLKDRKYSWSKLATVSADCIKSNGRQRNSSPTGHADESRRHLTAVSLIKENDSKAPHRVSLSPQRRSFGSGCSWKETSAGSAAPPTEELEVRSTRPSNKDRQWEPSGKDKKGSKQLPKTYRHEEEPEWLEFGPNDRFEVIELKGLEEHERGREEEIGRGGAGNRQKDEEEVGKGGRQKSCGDEVEKGGRKQSCEEDELGRERQQECTKGGAGDRSVVEQEKRREEGKQDFTKCKDLEVGEDTSVCEKSVKVVETVAVLVATSDSLKTNKHTEPAHSVPSPRDEDNFIVDGFDFSTGVSICLAMDEELDDLGHKGKNGVDESAALFKMMQTTDSPQALRTRPVNALTLEEIQARENISPSSSQHAERDHMPFNQILAVLSGSQPSSSSQSSGISTANLPSPSVTVGVAPSTLLPTPSNSNLAFHEMEGNSAHHLSTANQHRGNYLHYARPPPRPPAHLYSHDHQLSWGQPDLKPPLWGEEDRVTGRHHHMVSQSQAHWVSEMEQRRQMEAKQIYTQQIHGAPIPRTQVKSSGISLLPTSVMKRMYNTKMNQRVPDVTKAAGMDKADQDVPFHVRDYTVQNPQHFSTPMYHSNGPMHFSIPGQQQYSGFPSYPARHPSPYSR